MFTITIYTPKPHREEWIQEGIQSYQKRLSRDFAICWVFAKDNQHLESLLSKEEGYICLEEKGKLFDSPTFSTYLFDLLEKRGCRLSFVMGGAEGIPPAIVARGSGSLSLSPMTFPHQIARLLLLEQLYRAREIYRGTPYHK